MQVKLIYFTGMGYADPYFAARLLAYTKNTRLEQGGDTFHKFIEMPVEELEKELDYMSKTLRSSWEFCDYCFQIKGVSRALTHQLVRTRTGSYSQQAQRVVDMGNFDTVVPDTIAANPATKELWDSLMLAVSDTYQLFQQNGIPNQDARGILPTNVQTNIIAKFNLRTLADLVGKRKNLRAQGEYADVARAMEEQVLRIHPWANSFLNPDRLQTPALDKMLKEALGDRSPVDRPEINAALKELDNLKGTWG